MNNLMQNKKHLIVIIVALAILLIGIAAAKIMQSDDEKVDSSNEKSSLVAEDDSAVTGLEAEADSDGTAPGAVDNSPAPRGQTTTKPTQEIGRPQVSSPTPATNPPAASSSSSGQSVPKGDVGVWKHVFYDDFTKPAALGSWGELWDQNRIVYTGAEGQQWRVYPQSFMDTYDRRPYRSDQVLSVNNGLLNFHLHQVDGQPAGANPSPIIHGGSQYQTYGRYSARFKVDTPNLDEYYVAWLLWPESEAWPDDGEINFPEGTLSETINGFVHYADEGSQGPCRPNCQKDVYTTERFTDWHTYTIEWMPGRIRFILDDTVVHDSTDHIPNKPMRWQLQTETKGDGDNSGNLMLDWVSVWQYRP